VWKNNLSGVAAPDNCRQLHTCPRTLNLLVMPGFYWVMKYGPDLLAEILECGVTLTGREKYRHGFTNHTGHGILIKLHVVPTQSEGQ
jgi:hypothetical protein